MRRRSFVLASVAVALAGVSLLWAMARTTTESLSRLSVAADATAEARGAAAFEGAGFGGISLDALKTRALPWRLVAAALVLETQARDRSAPLARSTLDATLAGFGFFPDAEVANRPLGVSKNSNELPLGFSHGDLAPLAGTKIRVANLGCAACHAGVTYRADGSLIRAGYGLACPIPLCVHPDAALGNIGEAVDVMAFLRSYRPQPFPGAIDKDRAGHGRQLYATQCTTCHGRYDASLPPRLVEFPNWIGDVGTDGLRARLFDEPLAAAITRTSYGSKIAVVRGGNYAATPLTGIWASAPYLHNGSVPTLASLLSPDTRPPRFNVGGHALDFEQGGLKLDEAGNYPSGYIPFSMPALIDTTTPGRSNSGHRFGENLGAGDKHDLIEYLKLL